jgi:hypothetical protein
VTTSDILCHGFFFSKHVVYDLVNDSFLTLLKSSLLVHLVFFFFFFFVREKNFWL